MSPLGGCIIKTNTKIQILLSTYNGERYLKEQLDSYLALDNYPDIKVLIRDDGSTDGTREILRDYSSKYGFDIIEGENIGLNASMYELMRNRDKSCGYFSFSDQDDVWLPDKLTRAIDTLSKASADKPALYAACSNLTDEKLNVTGHTLIPKRKLSFYNAMVQNVCPGHSEVCNKAFMDIFSQIYSEHMMVFDYWAYLLATAAGYVYFDSKPTTLYRQHGSNVIGYQHSFRKALKVRINRVKTKVSVQNAKQLKALCDCASEHIAEEYKKEAEKFFSRQRNFFTRLAYLFRSKVYRQTRTETFIFRLMYLFARYNIN